MNQRGAGRGAGRSTSQRGGGTDGSWGGGGFGGRGHRSGRGKSGGSHGQGGRISGGRGGQQPFGGRSGGSQAAYSSVPAQLPQYPAGAVYYPQVCCMFISHISFLSQCLQLETAVRSTADSRVCSFPLSQAAFAPSHIPPGVGPADASGRSQIMDAVKAQIDYYFSVENLCKDIFLRSKVCAGPAHAVQATTCQVWRV